MQGIDAQESGQNPAKSGHAWTRAGRDIQLATRRERKRVAKCVMERGRLTRTEFQKLFEASRATAKPDLVKNLLTRLIFNESFRRQSSARSA